MEAWVSEVSTPLGRLRIRAVPEGVAEVHWVDDDEPPLANAADGVAGTPESAAARRMAEWAARELLEYTHGLRRTFSVPLAPQGGTPFQRRVWAVLRSIPYGETRTYAEVAAAIGNPRAVRAVGQANRANPLAVLVPCHRVIGARGDLVGYDGQRVHIKAKLLALESAAVAAMVD
jgi:methylated-DNA-[protein]-cysteine S-methyltransferase